LSLSELSANPHGIEIPGRPAREAGIVYASSRYILSGSSEFSHSFQATLGAVGPTIISTSLNAFLKSSMISVLI
jgi:hypothetical protein